MPFIETKTNIKLTKETMENLKSRFAKATSDSFPGKTENWLMVEFCDDSVMYFGGTSDPCMIVNVEIFGHATDASYDKMTSAVCEIVEAECGIPADRIYVKYEEIDHWGWNGTNF